MLVAVICKTLTGSMQLISLRHGHFIFIIMLLLCVLLVMISPSSSAFGNSISKPGCRDRCGNLPIPYPFGIGPNCSLNPSFHITCNTSTVPPKAYVYIIKELEVIEINTTYFRVRWGKLMNKACYNKPRTLLSEGNWSAIDLTSTQYTLSDENWLTAIGCDDMVLGIGIGNTTFGGGCASFCANGIDYNGTGFCPNKDNGFATGHGCCRTPIPRGTSYLGAKLVDTTGKIFENNEPKLYPCSYAFVEEKVSSNESNFSYPLTYLNRSIDVRNYTWGPTATPPVIRLDWRIGNESCKQANLKKAMISNNSNSSSSTSVCPDPKSECVDVGVDSNTRGYHCRCLNGYEGNPYLIQGCRDIDGCRDNPCARNSLCINTLGSYRCVCRSGYTGVGNMKGFACVKTPKNILHAVGLGIGSGFLLLLLACSWLYKVFMKRKDKMRREKFFKQNGGLLLEQKTNEGTIRKTKHFPAKELEKATDQFHESRILGEGGQGTVYKGMLTDGKIVAIKKSKQVNEDQLEQFINEIVILSQVDHRNVVKLLGCCLEDEVPLLVYEFVPNGTLFSLIHDPDNQFPISWNMRLKIAADIAGALAYLHYSTSMPIYHRDIKSSNILIGEKFVVKVSDFGTSKSVEVEKTHLTTLVKGTFGYLDPEYFQSGQYTDKSDVYSFGIVLVELLTGQRPISSQYEKSLGTRFLESMEQQILDSMLDPLVRVQSEKEEVIAVARLAQRCLNMMGKIRPSMKDVARELANYSNIAQISSTGNEEDNEEARAYEAKPMMISDIQYTWTTSGRSEISSSPDTHPFMYE